MRPAGLRAAGLSLLGRAAACAPAAPGRIDPDTCWRVALVDDAGASVIGAEDLALAGGVLLVSAYDRPAAERAARTADGPEPPTGGIYPVDPQALRRPARLIVHDLLRPALGRPSRPHGISAWVRQDGALMLAAVLRDYAREGGGWRMQASYALFHDTPGGWVKDWGPTDASPDLNDVAIGPRRFHGSFDGGRAWLGAADGRVATLPTGPSSAYRFPNGLVRDAAGRLWIAQTRDERIVAFDGMGTIALPGGPDNLNLAPDGRILAAVHPSLIRYALHRYGWPGGARAPTRIVAADPVTGAVETLLDDPDGRVFAGATTAAQSGGLLVLGAVREPGLLVCPLP